MARTARIAISCPDRTGLVAAITGRLFDLGANLADTAFAVLGQGAEFTAVCDFPDTVDLAGVEADLRGLPDLAQADVSVRGFPLNPVHGESGHITHEIVVSGADRPGLIARLCETLVGFRANIVRLNSERIPGRDGSRYVVQIAVYIPPASAAACLATISNTAQGLQLTCHWQEV